MTFFNRASGEHEFITTPENSQRLFLCPCCEQRYPVEFDRRPGHTNTLCDWCLRHCGDSICTRANNANIPRIYTVPLVNFRLWEWFNLNPEFNYREPFMPDRLNDALANSLPPRHRLKCMTCGLTITGNSALGTRLRMKFHRRSHRK